MVLFQGYYLDEMPTRQTRHILIQAEIDESASAPTEAQMSVAKIRAEKLLVQWQAGVATEESFAELANANSDDGSSNTNGGLYDMVYEGQFVPNYIEWLFNSARQSGTSVLWRTRAATSATMWSTTRVRILIFLSGW